jgi:Protein of unknown function (DUF3011)
MKNMMRGAMLLAGMVVVLMCPAHAAAQQITSQIITCSSDDGRRQICGTTYRNITNVQIVRQLSEPPCTQGQTWGFDTRGVWVDRGCGAQFRVFAWSGGWTGGGNSTVITCKSEDMRFNHCAIRGWVNNVQMVQQNSGSPCIQDQTWGWDERGVWVDRGCRANFRVWIGKRPSGRSVVILCQSMDMGMKRCRVDGFITGVELQQQYSGSPCLQDRTWGFDDRGLWVDRGCRADFRVWIAR